MPIEGALRTVHRSARSVSALGKIPKINDFLRVKVTRRKLRSCGEDASRSAKAEVLTPLLHRFSVNSNLLVNQFCAPVAQAAACSGGAVNGTVHRREAERCDGALGRNVSSDCRWLQMAGGRRRSLCSARSGGPQLWF